MSQSPRFTERQAATLIARAEAAAKAAFESATPTPMIVGQPKDPIGSLFGGDGGGIDYSQQTYYVAGGVCGFAEVNIGKGNTSFARHARKLAGARKAYYGGMEIRPAAGRSSQSYEAKTAACQAYADTLKEAGIPAYVTGRLD